MSIRPQRPSYGHVGWPVEAYVLIGREDMAATLAASALAQPQNPTSAVPATAAWGSSAALGDAEIASLVGSGGPVGTHGSSFQTPAAAPPALLSRTSLPSPSRQPALRTPVIGE